MCLFSLDIFLVLVCCSIPSHGRNIPLLILLTTVYALDSTLAMHRVFIWCHTTVLTPSDCRTQPMQYECVRHYFYTGYITRYKQCHRSTYLFTVFSYQPTDQLSKCYDMGQCPVKIGFFNSYGRYNVLQLYHILYNLNKILNKNRISAILRTKHEQTIIED